VLFQGDGTADVGLWITDGTAQHTSELPVPGAPASFDPNDFKVFNNEVLFGGNDASGFGGLWVTGGTAATTHELTGIHGANANGIFGSGGSGSSVPSLYPDLTVFNGVVLFEGYDTNGNVGFWVSNGTAAGTAEVGGIGDGGVLGAGSSGLFAGGAVPLFSVLNGEVLFAGDDANGDVGLWATSGTAAGTSELTGINGANASGILNFPDYSFKVFNGELLFSGYDANGDVGLWVTNGAAAGTSELTGIGGGSLGGLAPFNLTSAAVIRVPPIDNFNGNNTSDILFRNAMSGDTWFEAMSNGAFGGWTEIGSSNTSYGVAGTGDFYGTGTSDILYRSNSTGDTWIEAISNGAFAGWKQIGGSDTHYSVADVGDFYGAGTDDILFRNSSSGDTWFEAVSNGAFADWNQVGGSDTHYSVVGIGDFYGGGTDDILFRNSSTGDTWFEQMTNGASAGWHQIGGSDTHYSVVGVGDFFGNGFDDILFRNGSTGDTWLEAISNGAFAGWSEIGGSNTAYSVAGVGDFFGSNTSDILFRNSSSGDTWFEAISNGAFAGWHQVGGSNTSYAVPITVGPPALT
jgi:ELWxxDGT repeat protein